MPDYFTLGLNDEYVFRYGPGSGGNSRPELGRWIGLRNTGSNALFIPQKTETEYTAVYNNIGSLSGITLTSGQYGVYTISSDSAVGKLYSNTAAMGLPSGSACWSPSTPSATSATPPSCPSGFSDEGVTNTKDVQTSDEVGKTGVNHGDAGWMAYQYLGYYCPGSFVSNISVRVCSKD